MEEPKKINPIDQLKNLVTENIREQRELKEEFKMQRLKVVEVNAELQELAKNVQNSTRIASKSIEESAEYAGNYIDKTINNKVKNLDSIQVNLKESDKKLLDTIQSNFKLFKQSLYALGTLLLLSFITLVTSLYFAQNWYDTSIKSRQEIRQDILNQIANEGNTIVPKSEYTALRHERELIKGWVEANPNDSKSYNTHRKAIMNIEDNKDRIFFKTPTNDELRKGGEKGFFD